jgi:hypothetical protein
MPRSMRSNPRIGRLNERRCLHKENEVTALGKLINLSSEPSNIAFLHCFLEATASRLERSGMIAGA